MNRYIEAYRCYWLSLRQYAKHIDAGGKSSDMDTRLLYAAWATTNAELAHAKAAL